MFNKQKTNHNKWVWVVPFDRYHQWHHFGWSENSDLLIGQVLDLDEFW